MMLSGLSRILESNSDKILPKHLKNNQITHQKGLQSRVV